VGGAPVAQRSTTVLPAAAADPRSISRAIHA
jgi:hypothetical protein